MKTQTIREKFVAFFKKHHHSLVPSSSLIPHNDPTLLFVNSGMVQFKDVFLGREVRPYTRAVSIQRSLRAGGKHNDLDNVGFTARHHTFFEMLGNFSFGDYFKREAIHWAWDFLIQELGLSPSKLWVTVFEEDQEAESIWLNEIKVDPLRLSRIGAKDNFWSMGETGPCGPCTEIFYDHGPEVPGGPPGSPEAEGDRYIEIWNLVFMQFNRDKSGNLMPLPKPCVDTGMGLERLAAVLQGVHDNYEIDLFHDLIIFIAQLLGTQDLAHRSLRVIADHIRSTAFLILDGVTPSNEGRGYVLRRIMRRALRQGHKLGMTELFFHKIVEPLCKVMGKAYPELNNQKSRIIDTIQQEEIQFAKTLTQGIKEFEVALLDSKNIKNQSLIGSLVFKLYDTYGFPVDLTEDMAKERNLKIDHAGFLHCMEAQRLRAKEASKFGLDYNAELKSEAVSEFKGYFSSQESSQIAELFREGSSVASLSKGEEGIIVLQATPFYAESGGQVGDTGWIRSAKGGQFEVLDTQKRGGAILHFGKVLQGDFTLRQEVMAEIASELREETKRHHSATHLLHAALHGLIGSQITQKGSLVTPERLRFDFSYGKALSREEIKALEDWVNQKILANYPVAIIETSQEEARRMGAMALFGEKYGEKVRVIQMGLASEKSVSMELCGGTHVSHTGTIGFFKIIAETAVAAGIRRIEAVAGKAALTYCQDLESSLGACADSLKVPPSQVPEKVKALIDKNVLFNKQIEGLEKKIALASAEHLLKGVERIDEVNFLAQSLQMEPKNLKDLGLHLQDQLKSSVIVLGATHEGRANLLVLVSPDLIPRFHAGKWIAEIAPLIEGKGGGKAEMAQASGTKWDALQDAFDWLRKSIISSS